MIKKLEQYKWVILIVLILVVLTCVFYWYEWRPTEIRKYCINSITSINCSAMSDRCEALYRACLFKNGINK